MLLKLNTIHGHIMIIVWCTDWNFRQVNLIWPFFRWALFVSWISISLIEKLSKNCPFHDSENVKYGMLNICIWTNFGPTGGGGKGWVSGDAKYLYIVADYRKIKSYGDNYDSLKYFHGLLKKKIFVVNSIL